HGRRRRSRCADQENHQRKPEFMSDTETEKAEKAPAGTIHTPLEGRARLFGTVALSAAVFMNVLESSIANVSIPTIAVDLGVSVSQSTSVITPLAVPIATTVLLTVWLTQRFGHVGWFVISVMLFVIFPWLCAFAGSMEALVALRVLHGVV